MFIAFLAFLLTKSFLERPFLLSNFVLNQKGGKIMEIYFYNKEQEFYSNLEDSRITLYEIGNVWGHYTNDLYFLVDSPSTEKRFSNDSCMSYFERTTLEDFLEKSATPTPTTTTAPVVSKPEYYYIQDYLKSCDFNFLVSDIRNPTKSHEIVDLLMLKGFEPTLFDKKGKNADLKCVGFYTQFGMIYKVIHTEIYEGVKKAFDDRRMTGRSFEEKLEGSDLHSFTQNQTTGTLNESDFVYVCGGEVYTTLDEARENPCFPNFSKCTKEESVSVADSQNNMFYE